MANETKDNAVWINFEAKDLEGDSKAAFELLTQAKAAFEATFPCRDGFTLRFSYKGADFSRMGVTEVAKPRSREAVATNLSAWIAQQRAANQRH